MNASKNFKTGRSRKQDGMVMEAGRNVMVTCQNQKIYCILEELNCIFVSIFIQIGTNLAILLNLINHFRCRASNLVLVLELFGSSFVSNNGRDKDGRGCKFIVVLFKLGL